MKIKPFGECSELEQDIRTALAWALLPILVLVVIVVYPIITIGWRLTK